MPYATIKAKQEWRRRETTRAASRVYKARERLDYPERVAARKKESLRRQRIAHPLEYMLACAKKNSLKRGLPPLTATVADLLLPDGSRPVFCPVFGLRLRYGGTGRPIDESASLDRIDSRRGYESGNVRVISWLANRLKHGMTRDQILALARYVSGGSDGKFNTA